MSWRDAFRLAMESATRRFGRTVLTALAVTLASALLVALATIVVTANSRVINQVSKGGPITAIRVAAAAAQPGQLETDSFRQGAARPITGSDLSKIEALPGVSQVLPVQTVGIYAVPSGTAEDQPKPFFDQMVGVDLRRPANLPVTVLAGRLPSPGLSNETAVSLGYLDRLGIDASTPEKAIGRIVELGAPQRSYEEYRSGMIWTRWVGAKIVGVVAQDAAPGEFLVSIEQASATSSWTRTGTRSPGGYSGLIVVADTLAQVHRVRSEITALGYATSAPEQLIANVQRYLRVVDIVLSAIGVIALVIAALGITNALLAAVRERRREIGVLKAIGARDRDIMRVFLLEAGFVGLLGGAAGTLLGATIARVVAAVVNGYLQTQGLAGVRLVAPLGVIAAGIGGATLLSLIAGTAPARRAARLPAREAVGGA